MGLRQELNQLRDRARDKQREAENTMATVRTYQSSGDTEKAKEQQDMAARYSQEASDMVAAAAAIEAQIRSAEQEAARHEQAAQSKENQLNSLQSQIETLQRDIGTERDQAQTLRDNIEGRGIL